MPRAVSDLSGAGTANGALASGAGKGCVGLLGAAGSVHHARSAAYSIQRRQAEGLSYAEIFLKAGESNKCKPHLALSWLTFVIESSKLMHFGPEKQ
jgi:hypothetical protein